MNTNVLICRNEVYIEGTYVGKFESFECKADSHTLGQTGVLTLPLYAIGTGVQSGSARSRLRATYVQGADKDVKSLIRPCAEVKVYCWYTNTFWANEGETTVLRSIDGEKTLVFNGFIEHIAEGFPTVLHLRDNSATLLYGSVEKQWEDKTLQSILGDILPVAQEAFDAERKRLGFTREIPRIKYSVEKKNVQAFTNPIDYRSLGASPLDAIQSLMSQLVLYGGVDRDFNVYVGAGVTENTRPIIHLDTRYNVIERDLVDKDNRFVDYHVKVVGLTRDGKVTTTIGGESKRAAEAQDKKTVVSGKTVTYFSPLSDDKGLRNFADMMLANLKGSRNSGKIKLLMYPKIEIMDWITYTDTVFEELSSGYYVLGYSFKADERGYFQEIEVTDQVFAI